MMRQDSRNFRQGNRASRRRRMSRTLTQRLRLDRNVATRQTRSRRTKRSRSRRGTTIRRRQNSIYRIPNISRILPIQINDRLSAFKRKALQLRYHKRRTRRQRCTRRSNRDRRHHTNSTGNFKLLRNRYSFPLAEHYENPAADDAEVVEIATDTRTGPALY